VIGDWGHHMRAAFLLDAGGRLVVVVLCRWGRRWCGARVLGWVWVWWVLVVCVVRDVGRVAGRRGIYRSIGGVVYCIASCSEQCAMRCVTLCRVVCVLCTYTRLVGLVPGGRWALHTACYMLIYIYTRYITRCP
jgi:hypothetical protein